LISVKKTVIYLVMTIIMIMFCFETPAGAADTNYVMFIGTTDGASSKMLVTGVVQKDFYGVLGNDLSTLGKVLQDYYKGAKIEQLREEAKNSGLVTGVVKAGAETTGQYFAIPNSSLTMGIYVKNGTFVTDGGQTYSIADSIITLLNAGNNGAKPAGSTPVPASEDKIKLVINSQMVYPEVAPVIIKGTTMVPLRVVAEELGLSVSYDNATRTVFVTQGATKVSLVINGKAFKDGQEIPLNVPATLINGKTMVPVRLIAEAFGARVSWDSMTKTVGITNQ